ncbi:amphi-Trp domain-containing protein [Halobacteria archaeon AArc-dxtr1]|nr:amphi-Trp domain-containing protein [Halobacteria archaeon AArc-dxtr1]
MGDTTSHEEELARESAAARLQELARELDSDGTADVRVGNKMVTLTPASVLNYDIETQERSPMLGGHSEEITVKLSWKREKAEEE